MVGPEKQAGKREGEDVEGGVFLGREAARGNDL